MIFLFILIQFSPPADSASELLTQYLSIRTEQPNSDSNQAARFWTEEAVKLGIDAATFSIDPNGRCTNFVAYLPATVSQPKDPILLVHHSDVVPANDSEWKYSPYAATWVSENGDAKIYGRGVIDDKGPGIIHWEAIRRLKASESIKRSHDIFFVMNCGEEVADPFGAAAFVNFLIRPLPDSYFFMASHGYELTSVNKLEVARLLEKFPRLAKIGFVWNKGSFGSTSEIAPYTLIPVANAQKGLWKGRISVRGPSGHGSLASKETTLEALVRGMTGLYDQNTSLKNRFQSLHSEQAQMASIVASTRPWYQRLLLKIYPRAFFDFAGLQTLVTSWWQAKAPGSNSPMPNVVASESSATIEYRFLGEKTVQEIENQVSRNFRKFTELPLTFEVQTVDYVPFRRSFFEDAEADAFKAVLEAYPKAVVSPFITPGITDSRFFRMVGIKSFDLVPVFLTREEIRAMHGANESLRHAELMRAIDIETNVLQKLLR